MKKENKIYLLKDQNDFVKKLTNDKVINIIGTKGSGKTTSSLKYIENDDYIVVNLDRLFDLPETLKFDKELIKIQNMLKKKYGSIKEQEFTEYYFDIINYILDKNKEALIEGNSIQGIEPSLLKGTIIIKRTAVLKSFIRAVKRDYKNKYFMNLEKKKHKYLYKLTRLCKITKRRTKIFRQAKYIEIIIDELEKI